MKEKLLDDLILDYIINKNKNSLEKAIRILINCGFSQKESEEIINLEIEIIKNRKEISFPIINKYFWLQNISNLNEKNESGLLNNLNDYLVLRYDNSNIYDYSNVLTLSELALLYDEAYYIKEFRKDSVNSNIYKSCLLITINEGMKSWVIREFKTRLEEVCRQVNKINDDKASELIASDQIDNLYRHEISILLSEHRYNNN